LEFLIGVSLTIGFLVRPAALLGMLLFVNLIYSGNDSLLELNKIVFAVLLLFFWTGAGRCLGLDYFFYKRKRGLLW